jgi:transcriptional regulator with XRE-family HTH domain
MDFSERIAAVMRHYNLQAKDLATLCGVQRTAITHILNGRNRPSVGFLSQLSDAFPELNTRWLLHGRGNIFTNVTGDGVGNDRHANSINPIKIDGIKSSPDSVPAKATQGIQKDSHVTSVTIDLFDPREIPNNETASTIQKGEKSIREIIIFYEDGTFKAYRPD